MSDGWRNGVGGRHLSNTVSRPYVTLAVAMRSLVICHPVFSTSWMIMLGTWAPAGMGKGTLAPPPPLLWKCCKVLFVLHMLSRVSSRVSVDEVIYASF